MGDLVLSNVKEEKWDIGFLGVFFLTHKLLMFKNENLPFRINIPLFHHSMPARLA